MDIFQMILVGLGYFSFLYGLNNSIKVSPNPGYSKGIVAGSTILVPFVAQFLFINSFLSTQQWLSIVISTVCISQIATCAH